MGVLSNWPKEAKSRGCRAGVQIHVSLALTCANPCQRGSGEAEQRENHRRKEGRREGRREQLKRKEERDVRPASVVWLVTMVAEMVRSPSRASPQKELEGQEAKAEDGQAETEVKAER